MKVEMLRDVPYVCGFTDTLDVLQEECLHLLLLAEGEQLQLKDGPLFELLRDD